LRPRAATVGWLLHQVDLVVPARGGGRAAAVPVAKPGAQPAARRHTPPGGLVLVGSSARRSHRPGGVHQGWKECV